jgi:endonuclease/exonuclease/phosphatase family metal-dependent hydrolase
MTRNLYVGASLDPLAAASGAEELFARVDEIWAAVVASDPAARMAAVAREIAAAAPALVALQEAARWEAGPGGFDLLELLRGALGALGARYRVVALGENFGGTLPGAASGPVTLRDRDVVLAAEGVEVADSRAARFGAAASVTVGGVAVEVPRGRASAVARLDGRELRFVAAHLEIPIEPAAAVQRAQVAELVAELAAEPLPVVLAGDLNTDPGRASSSAYDALRAAGLRDAWLEAGGDPRGDTCCQARDLRNPRSTLFERIDHVLLRGPLAGVAASRTGAVERERTAAGLWPSDHAGVVVELAWK